MLSAELEVVAILRWWREARDGARGRVARTSVAAWGNLLPPLQPNIETDDPAEGQI